MVQYSYNGVAKVRHILFTHLLRLARGVHLSNLLRSALTHRRRSVNTSTFASPLYYDKIPMTETALRASLHPLLFGQEVVPHHVCGRCSAFGTSCLHAQHARCTYGIRIEKDDDIREGKCIPASLMRVCSASCP